MARTVLASAAVVLVLLRERVLAESVLESVPADSRWALKASKVLVSLLRRR